MSLITEAKLPQRNQLRSAQETVMKLRPKPSPSRPLFDLRLPEKYTESLELILNRLPGGFTLTDSFVEDDFGDRHDYTLISNHGIKRHLLQIPDSILRNPCPNNKLAVNGVRDIFVDSLGSGITLYVFHDREPHGMFELLMQTLWKNLGITIKFKALSKLKDLQEMREATQNRYVKALFNLDVQPDRNRKLEFPKAVFDQIVDLLCVDNIAGVGKRKAAIAPAFSEYKSLYDKIDWSGSPKTFAVRLVELFKGYGEVEIGKHAIVALLEALRPHVGISAREIIAQILERIG